MSTKKSVRGVLIGLFIAAIVVAGAVSYYASSSPDGLEKVAADNGLDANERAHNVKDSPLADYSVKGVSNDRASVGVAGIVGVLAVGGIGAALFMVIGRRRPATGSASHQATDIGV